MRLIDADVLKIRDVSPCYGSEQMGVTDVDIENAPTIEAIPVEWISKRIGVLIAHGHVSQASCLAAEIISLWREEQC